MAAKQLCLCYCHQEARGNYVEARHWQRHDAAMEFSRSPVLNVVLPVDADDPIEAAVASGCLCLKYHCPALFDGPDLFGKPWSPQADGEGDE